MAITQPHPLLEKLNNNAECVLFTENDREGGQMSCEQL